MAEQKSARGRAGLPSSSLGGGESGCHSDPSPQSFPAAQRRLPLDPQISRLATELPREFDQLIAFELGRVDGVDLRGVARARQQPIPAPAAGIRSCRLRSNAIDIRRSRAIEILPLPHSSCAMKRSEIPDSSASFCRDIACASRIVRIRRPRRARNMLSELEYCMTNCFVGVLRRG